MAETGNGLDLVWGGVEIAKLIGRTPRQTFHMLEKGELPARKIGERWVIDRAQLIRFFVEAA